MNTGTLPLMPTGDAIKGASTLPPLPPPLPSMAPPVAQPQPPPAPQIPVANQPVPQASGVGLYQQPPAQPDWQTRVQQDGSVIYFYPGPAGDGTDDHVIAVSPAPKALAKLAQPQQLPAMGMPGMQR